MRQQNGEGVLTAQQDRKTRCITGVGVPPFLTHSFCREIGHFRPF